MASRQEDEITQELNFIFKSMGERGKEGEMWKNYTGHCLTYMLQGISEYFTKKFDNCMVLRGYGSAVEDLKVLAADDVGDLDIVICPKSVDLMIHDEMIEYSVNPMHVKIIGIKHPVLQRCLVQDTEYVATSALKNFHSEIYGRSAPRLVDFLTRLTDIMNEEEWVHVSEWKNNKTSPALTIDYTQSFGPISGESEKLKNPQTLTNLDAREWEWLAHSFCKSRGVKYSKEHADVVKEYIEFAKEVQTSYFEKGLLCQPETFPLFVQELVFSDRAKNMRDQVREIETQMMNESGKRRDCFPEEGERKHQYDVQKDCCENESGECEEENSKETSLSKAGSSITTARKADDNKRSAVEDFRTTFSHSKVNRTSGTAAEHLTKADENGNEDSNQNGNELCPERDRELQKEELLPVDGLPSKPVLQHNPKDEYEEFKTLSSQNYHLFEHIFKKFAEEARSTPGGTCKSTHTSKAPIQGGFDLVPAFKSPGWPKVALDWRKRERKWPSPEIVHKVVQEGFHLVVKPPKKGGNPECDFRISFSHPEYLLSQEMNDIQRDCYRCLKKYHRAYLQEPKGLVTFHLKNIFLKTIEETGSETWTESNRAECMMKLLGNLLEALVTRDLRHFFVGSYNLFSIDYIENPDVLDSLAEKTVQIIERPLHFAKLIQEEAAKQLKTEKWTPSSDSAGNTESRLRHGDMEQTPARGSDAGKEKVPIEVGTTHPGSSSNTSYSFHELKEIYLTTGQELIDRAFKDGPLQDVPDSLEKCLVGDLREMIVKQNIQGEELSKVFETFWDIVYWKVWMSPEPNMRRRMLDAFQGVIATMKYLVRQDDLAMENVEAIAARMLNPDAEDPLVFSNLYPAGIGTQLINRFLSSLERSPDQPQQTSMDDIPLD